MYHVSFLWQSLCMASPAFLQRVGDFITRAPSLESEALSFVDAIRLIPTVDGPRDAHLRTEGACRTYLARVNWAPTNVADIERAFDEWARQQPLRSQMEAFADKLAHHAPIVGPTEESALLEDLRALDLDAAMAPEERVARVALIERQLREVRGRAFLATQGGGATGIVSTRLDRPEVDGVGLLNERTLAAYECVRGMLSDLGNPMHPMPVQAQERRFYAFKRKWTRAKYDTPGPVTRDGKRRLGGIHRVF